MTHPIMTAAERDAYYKAKKKEEQKELRKKLNRRMDVMERIEIERAMKDIYL